MSVVQNRLIIRQGVTFNRVITFKKAPDPQAGANPTLAEALAADPFPLTGTGIRGMLENSKGVDLIDLAPTYEDASLGQVRVTLTAIQTAALPEVEAFCDFHQDFAGSVVANVGRVLFKIIRQSTP